MLDCTIAEIIGEEPPPQPAIQDMITATDTPLVLDPFFGSGTTAVAAIQEGRDFIGIERASTYQAMSARRLRQAALKAGRNIQVHRNPDMRLK